MNYKDEFRFNIKHRNIINIIEGNVVLGEDDTQYLYMIMERGIPLLEFFKNGITLKQVRQITLDVIEGLIYLHNEFIVHRDIKPDNILIIVENNRWRAVIIDFNVAKKIGYQKANEFCGTQGFMAPELIDGLDYDY